MNPLPRRPTRQEAAREPLVLAVLRPAPRGRASWLRVGVALLASAISIRAIAANEGAVTVTAAATPAEVTVGQRFTVEVRADAPAGTVLTFPETVGNDEIELALLLSDESTPSGSNSVRYQGRSFKLRDAVVPPISVKFRLPDSTEGEAASQPVPLTTVSLVPKGDAEGTLADVRPPVSVPLTALFIAAALSLAAALVGLVVLLARRRRRPAAVPSTEEPTVPADAEAAASLDRLAAAGLIEREEYRAFYIALADIAKRYLERRLEAPVLEMTTTEMATFLRDHPFGRDLAPTARDLAGAADHVKFARGSAQRAIAERHLAQVRGMVAALEQRLAAAHEPEPSLRRTA